jgi:sensor histidine kinase regulating citrate/malate metabolism
VKNAYLKVNAAVALLGILGAAGWLYLRHEAIQTAAVERIKKSTADYIQQRASMLVKTEDFMDEQAARRQQTFQQFFYAVQSPDLVRMKVWDRNFTVIWSDLDGLVGQRFPENHEVKEALAGEIEFEMGKAKDEHVSERSFAELSEIYVPFANAQGEIVGVFEVYRPVISLNEQIASNFRKSLAAVLVLAALALAGAAYFTRFLMKRKNEA